MQGINTIFSVIVLIMSVVMHEIAHGLAADAQGDPTARQAGRLSLNPIRHLDLVGSVLLPILLLVFNAGFIIGWARPVPYTEGNLRNKRWGTALVAVAGVAVNIALALFFALLIRIAPHVGLPPYDILHPHPFYVITITIALINFILALFNLIPIPPLDGSKILFTILGGRMRKFQSTVEYFSLPLLLVFIVFLWPLIAPVVGYLFGLISGIPMVLS